MTAPPPQPGAALDEEVGKLGEFVALLQREQELLKNGDTETLLPLIETKTRLANGLTALSQARENHLARLGLAGGRVGMDAWLARHGDDRLKATWQDLLQLAGEARSLNELNGKLIGLHMRHNHQAFTALMGATDRAMTYGPDGQQQTGLGGRILGKA
jgi:flagella synthesis protein FlgN